MGAPPERGSWLTPVPGRWRGSTLCKWLTHWRCGEVGQESSLAGRGLRTGLNGKDGPMSRGSAPSGAGGYAGGGCGSYAVEHRGNRGRYKL